MNALRLRRRHRGRARLAAADNGGRLSRSRGAHRQSVSARRIGRRHGAAPRAEALREHRPAIHRREPRRGRRQCRRRVGREIGPGRLHAAVHRARPPGRQPDALHQGPAVRSDAGLRADRAVRDLPDRADGEPATSGHQCAGADRLCEEAPRHDQFRLGRQRLDPAYERGACSRRWPTSTLSTCPIAAPGRP